ncbi:ABC transporter substrate-binding protein [Devosia sp.]|uniref:ABC transporter substrate-binding protein n=1 Tax=Devosia sp. TaxID=1871048 RepID=UPI001B22239C|nr:ABC transporter substrate-binding protein [Devosia sp.]MBO9587438.1 hypothetical protein [Devosia sp.]
MTKTVARGLSLLLCGTMLAAVPSFAQDAQTGGTLRVVTYEPLCLDQNEGSSRNTQTALQDVYDRLVSEDLEGQFHPWIASEWSISDDGLTYAFTIRDGVLFHDGTALDAEAVRVNLQRWVDDKGAGGVPVESVAVDGNVVTVTLKSAYSPLLHDLSEPVLGFVSPASIEKYSKEDRCTGGPDITVGSGPFKVVARTSGQDLILERNDAYAWAPENAVHDGAAYLDRVELRFLTEDAVRVGAVESDQADIATGVPAIAVEDVEANANLTLLRTEQPGIPWSFWVNQSKPALADVKVREALRIGVDYPALIEAVFLGTATPAYSALTPGISFGYDAKLEGSWSYDPAAAAALLDEAGWVVGSDGIREKDGARLSLVSLSAVNWNNQQRELFAQGIQANLQQIGVEFTREVLDFATVDARFKANEYDLVDTSQSAAEPNLLFGAFQSEQLWETNTNWGFVNDPALDAELEAALATTDRDERIGHYVKAQEIIKDNAYLIPIANPQVLIAVNNRVQGVTFGTSGQVGSYYDVWLQQ